MIGKSCAKIVKKIDKLLLVWKLINHEFDENDRFGEISSTIFTQKQWKTVVFMKNLWLKKSSRTMDFLKMVNHGFDKEDRFDGISLCQRFWWWIPIRNKSIWHQRDWSALTGCSHWLLTHPRTWKHIVSCLGELIENSRCYNNSMTGRTHRNHWIWWTWEIWWVNISSKSAREAQHSQCNQSFPAVQTILFLCMMSHEENTLENTPLPQVGELSRLERREHRPPSKMIAGPVNEDVKKKVKKKKTIKRKCKFLKTFRIHSSNKIWK